MSATAVRAAEVARGLLLDAAGAEAIAWLQAEEIGVVLLKGPVIASWLYDPDEERTYRDIDLLVEPSRFDDALRVLDRLGYTALAVRQTGTQAQPRALPLRRGGAVLDVHSKLLGVGVDEVEAWQILTSRTEQFRLNGITVSTLALPARALHLGLHAAQRGARDQHTIEDLRRGLTRLEFGVWIQAAELAQALKATAAFSVGLRLTTDGRSVADRLHLSTQASAETQLRADAASDAVLFIERLHAACWSSRVELVRSALFPRSDWLLEISGADTPSRQRVVQLRLRRTVSVLSRALPAYRDWRRRRSAEKHARPTPTLNRSGNTKGVR